MTNTDTNFRHDVRCGHCMGNWSHDAETHTNAIAAYEATSEHPTMEMHDGIWEYRYRYFDRPILVEVVGGYGLKRPDVDPDTDYDFGPSVPYGLNWMCEVNFLRPVTWTSPSGHTYNQCYMEEVDPHNLRRPTFEALDYALDRAYEAVEHAEHERDRAVQNLESAIEQRALIQGMFDALKDAEDD